MARSIRTALVPVFVAMTAFLAVAPSVAAQESPTEDDSAAEPVTVTLVRRGPWIGPDDRLPFEITTTGTGPDDLVRLVVGPALDRTAPLDADPFEDDPARGALSVGAPVRLADLPIGLDDTRTVALRTGEPDAPEGDEPEGDAAPSRIRLDRGGVHRVTIDVLDPDGVVLARTTTPVVAIGRDEDALRPLDLAIVFDVARPPTLEPDGSRIDDAALAALAERVLTTTALPDADRLTVAPRPDTIDALASMATSAGTDALDALAGRPAVALPYLPVDIDALRAEDLIGLLPDDFARGAATVRDTIGVPILSVWDPVTQLSQAAATLLADLGTTHVLVDASALPDPEDSPDPAEEAPDGAALTDAGPRLVRGNVGLSAIIVDDAAGRRLRRLTPDRVDAGHRVLADLVRAPRTGDRLVVRTNGITERSAAGAVLPLLTDDGPVRLRHLDQVIAAGQPATEPRVDLAAATAALPRDQLAQRASQIVHAANRLRTFETLLDPGSARGDALRLQLLTALAAGRDDGERRASVNVVLDDLSTAFDGLRLTGQTDLNLTARSGELPVTLTNTNGFPATVLVRVRSDRLAFPEGEAILVRVAGPSIRLDIAVDALATGSVPVFVELWTADEALLLDTQQLNVRSTAISGVGLALSLGALLVLVVWWFRSWRRDRG